MEKGTEGLNSGRGGNRNSGCRNGVRDGGRKGRTDKRGRKERKEKSVGRQKKGTTEGGREVRVGRRREVGTDWWVEGREYRIFSIKKTNHRLLNNFDLHLVLTNF